MNQIGDSRIVNALCVDVDDLMGALHEAGRAPRNTEYHAFVETLAVIEDFEALGLKATFFVPGLVARNSPRLVKEIQAAGHQIASHGDRHCAVRRLGRQGFLEDVRASKRTLEDLTGEVVDTYKAPMWSITRRCAWAYDVLIEAGYRVDHSAMPPLKRFLGVSANEIVPFRYQKALLVIPPTTIRLAGVALPFCGGFYTAHVPVSVQKRQFARINDQGQPFNYYFHPFEYAPVGENRRIFKHRSLYATLYAAHAGVFKTHLRKLAPHFRFDRLQVAYQAFLADG